MPFANEKYDSIYDLAFKKRKHNPKISNEKAIEAALVALFKYSSRDTMIKLMGLNTYLEYLNLKEEHFKDSVYVSNEEEIIKKYYLIAGELRKRHFNNSGLESTIIAHGMENKFKV
ncbi:MAG: hypothetical protein KC516_01490 [Nanoarchaeota archaeon]|nr:hypothetical protein [Nanoarchaeota archaeon]